MLYIVRGFDHGQPFSKEFVSMAAAMAYMEGLTCEAKLYAWFGTVEEYIYGVNENS